MILRRFGVSDCGLVATPMEDLRKSGKQLVCSFEDTNRLAVSVLYRNWTFDVLRDRNQARYSV